MKKWFVWALMALLAAAVVALGIRGFKGDADRSARIEALTAQATETAAQIEALNADVADKDAQIEALNADVADKAAQIEALNADVADKNAQVEALNADVADKAAQIESLTTNLDARNAEIEQKQSQLDQASDALDISDAKLKETESLVVAQRLQIEAKNEVLNSLQAKIDEAEATIADQKERLASLEAEVSGLNGVRRPVVIPFGSSYSFTTQVDANGIARVVSTEGAPFETVSFTMRITDWLLPPDFERIWGNTYKLKGSEAGVGFELTLNDYAGTAAIIPQNAFKVYLVGETEVLGYQLMDAAIAGNLNVDIERGETVKMWKRYAYFGDGESIRYLAVEICNDGIVETLLFEVAAASTKP